MKVDFNYQMNLPLEVRDVRHLRLQEGSEKIVDGGFRQLFLSAISELNGDQQHLLALQEKAITSPDEVDVHDVTIAMAKAEMSLGIAKAVTDRVVQAYQTIVNLN